MIESLLINNQSSFSFSIFRNFPVVAVVSRRNYNLGFKNTTVEAMIAGRKEFLSSLGIIPEYLVAAKQAHGNSARVVARADRGNGAFDYATALDETDALISRERGVPIAVFTADCLSVFIYDAKTHACAVVHAGWRSTATGILSNTLGLMRDEFGCRREDLLLAFGPSICKGCYEVGEEFRGVFPKSVSWRNGKFYFDLSGENLSQALIYGIPRDNISICGKCNFCDSENFFSYRREGPACGRNMSVMMLK